MDAIVVAEPKKTASFRLALRAVLPPLPPFQFLLIFILSILLLLIAKREVQITGKYVEGTEGYVYLDEDGNPQVIPEVYERLEKQKKKREECVQYVAVASGDGYRACYTCPDYQKSIFLKSGEVWKYGETCEFESRQNALEYKINRVILPHKTMGQKDYCYKVQLDSIYLYKIHYQNLMRLKNTGIWLKLPPGNKIYR
ncbi:MAG: hypothetical protein H6559_34500 [Lewinellaceae bacterium]|nr:hypothetical protein [Lewinellaceae bacterium]